MARPIRLTFHGTLLLVFLAILGVMAATPARQAFDQRMQIQREEAKLAVLQAENERLEKHLQRLNDPDYIETLARQQLGLVKPGEVSFVIVPGATQTATAEAEQVDDRPWYRRIGDWFKGLF